MVVGGRDRQVDEVAARVCCAAVDGAAPRGCGLKVTGSDEREGAHNDSRGLGLLPSHRHVSTPHACAPFLPGKGAHSVALGASESSTKLVTAFPGVLPTFPWRSFTHSTTCRGPMPPSASRQGLVLTKGMYWLREGRGGRGAVKGHTAQEKVSPVPGAENECSRRQAMCTA